MKTKAHLLFVLVALTHFSSHSQGTFVYDQQSSDENTVYAGGVYINPLANPAQSFTPSLGAVQFIRLYIDDRDFQDNLGATLAVNLRSNSFNGPILGSSAPVPIANGFDGTVNFIFDSAKSVTPGGLYFFDIIRTSGPDTFTANISLYNYSPGQLFVLGAPDTQNGDMWFREGIIVPEPSTALFLLGGGIVALFVRRRRQAN